MTSFPDCFSSVFLSFRLNGAGLEFSGKPVVFEKALEAVDIKRNAEAIRLRRGKVSRREAGEGGAACRDPGVDKKSDKLSITGEPTICSLSSSAASSWAIVKHFLQNATEKTGDLHWKKHCKTYLLQFDRNMQPL